jgi:cytochrome c553
MMYAFTVALLLGLMTPDTPPSALHVQQADGKTVWDQSCKKCHGAKGTPAAAMQRMLPKLPVLDSALVSTFSMASVVDVVTKGKGTMKPLTKPLTPEQVAAVSKYLFELTNAKPAASKAGK